MVCLTFRRASCVLKSLPHPLTSLQQIQNVTHVGSHSKKVIQDILEDGHSMEVDSIVEDPWFNKMKVHLTFSLISHLLYYVIFDEL